MVADMGKTKRTIVQSLAVPRCPSLSLMIPSHSLHFLGSLSAMRKGVRIDAQGVTTTLLTTAVVALIATVLLLWRDSAVEQEQLRQLERRVDGLENSLEVRADFSRYFAGTRTLGNCRRFRNPGFSNSTAATFGARSSIARMTVRAVL